MSEPKLRTVKIIDLQPTDQLRTGTLSFLETLSLNEIHELGAPQAWETQEGLLISDGNNRVAVLARKGQETVDVDYNNIHEISNEHTYFKNEITQRAKELRERGIYSFDDLWHA